MALAEYVKAYKLGKKEYQARILQEQNPTLPVLDEILPTRGTFSEVPLGLVQIPMDQIVGTKKQRICSKFHADFKGKYGVCP